MTPPLSTGRLLLPGVLALVSVACSVTGWVTDGPWFSLVGIVAGLASIVLAARNLRAMRQQRSR